VREIPYLHRLLSAGLLDSRYAFVPVICLRDKTKPECRPPAGAEPGWIVDNSGYRAPDGGTVFFGPRAVTRAKGMHFVQGPLRTVVERDARETRLSSWASYRSEIGDRHVSRQQRTRSTR
jgi:hypothetical protein